MLLTSKARGAGLAIYYDPKFRKVLEDHMEILRTHPETSSITISHADMNKYKWNITGYLATLCEPHMVWLIQRLNGYKTDEDYDGTNDTLLIPSTNAVEDIRMRYLVLA